LVVRDCRSSVAKERIAMAYSGRTLRRIRASRWFAPATALSLCALAAAYWVPQAERRRLERQRSRRFHPARRDCAP
jgi:hypothetical protein